MNPLHISWAPAFDLNSAGRPCTDCRTSQVSSPGQTPVGPQGPDWNSWGIQRTSSFRDSSSCNQNKCKIKVILRQNWDIQTMHPYNSGNYQITFSPFHSREGWVEMRPGVSTVHESFSFTLSDLGVSRTTKLSTSSAGVFSS